jgi:hypothetical protein
MLQSAFAWQAVSDGNLDVTAGVPPVPPAPVELALSLLPQATAKVTKNAEIKTR